MPAFAVFFLRPVGISRGIALLLAALLIPAAHAQEDNSTTPAIGHPEALSGGETTVFETGRDAYALSARNLTRANRRGFFVGNSFFNENWVSAPSSTEGRDGLGPLFNANSCSTCHFKDGRGTPPLRPDDSVVSMIFRLSAVDGDGTVSDEPRYGGQLQNRAVVGLVPEGQVRISYDERPGRYPDGTTYTLRFPRYRFDRLALGEMSSATLISPRVSPAVFGLGLLEAIAESDLLTREDPEDRDQDGISGRANRVRDVRKKWTVVGRFGWKANQPSLEQQNAAAFANDLGITSDLFPDHLLTDAQEQARRSPHGGDPELDAKKLDRVTLYTRTLAVPARRDVEDPDVMRGKALFAQVNCAACHVETYRTGSFPELPELENQIIHPYTDLLLHDMGEELADDRPDGLATGREWRTPPLWGIGLVETVNGHTNFLHDGRARGLEEAILWHGGEGAAARDAFKALSAEERDCLLRFLNSL